jgi:hypothetical protein
MLFTLVTAIALARARVNTFAGTVSLRLVQRDAKGAFRLAADTPDNPDQSRASIARTSSDLCAGVRSTI